jgi:hypothetical protein|tara:strand:- start:979 stop:1083 length:105 start_codon:yes stop_codon:yes gene_type:complete
MLFGRRMLQGYWMLVVPVLFKRRMLQGYWMLVLP